MVEVVEIVVITYALVELIKTFRNLKSEHIPAMCCVIGATLGCVCFYVMESFPANNVITAIATGIVSGLAATGGHQIIKQYTKKKGASG